MEMLQVLRLCVQVLLYKGNSNKKQHWQGRMARETNFLDINYLTTFHVSKLLRVSFYIVAGDMKN